MKKEFESIFQACHYIYMAGIEACRAIERGDTKKMEEAIDQSMAAQDWIEKNYIKINFVTRNQK